MNTRQLLRALREKGRALAATLPLALALPLTTVALVI